MVDVSMPTRQMIFKWTSQPRFKRRNAGHIKPTIDNTLCYLVDATLSSKFDLKMGRPTIRSSSWFLSCKNDSRYSDSNLVRYGWGFFPHKRSKWTKTQLNNKIMRHKSRVLPHIFVHLLSKQRFQLYIWMHISVLLSKTSSMIIVFG